MNTFIKFIMGMAGMIITAQGLSAAPPKLMIVPDKSWCNGTRYIVLG